MTKESLPHIQLLQKVFVLYAKEIFTFISMVKYYYLKHKISEKKLTAEDIPHLMNNLTKTWISSHHGCFQMLMTTSQDANMITSGSFNSSSVVL